MVMMMKSVESVRLLAILADVPGSIIKGVVCRCLLLGLKMNPCAAAQSIDLWTATTKACFT